MALNSSGPISLGGTVAGQSANLELGLTATTAISLDDARIRKLTGTSAGTQISMPANFWGKANKLVMSISSNISNANLRTLAIAAGWDQNAEVAVTIASGVYVYSTDVATPALTIDGSWPSGVTVTNNGYIIGKGGDATYNSVGQAGGSAIYVSSFSVSIVNNSYIAGGGGAGGGSGTGGAYFAGGGGGAGGGNGGSLAGGAGGAPGQAGSNGTYHYINGTALYVGSGGGGGRILPGTGGAGATYTRSTSYIAPGGGSGGGGGTNWVYMPPLPGGLPAQGGAFGGGGGGGWGASGGGGGNYQIGGQAPVYAGGAGGSSSSAGGNWTGSPVTYAGGAGGKAIALNGYAVNRTGSGTTYGAVS